MAGFLNIKWSGCLYSFSSRVKGFHGQQCYRFLTCACYFENNNIIKVEWLCVGDSCEGRIHYSCLSRVTVSNPRPLLPVWLQQSWENTLFSLLSHPILGLSRTNPSWNLRPVCELVCGLPAMVFLKTETNDGSENYFLRCCTSYNSHDKWGVCCTFL